MRQKVIFFVMVGVMSAFLSGCAVLGTALSAGIGYAIYQATNK